MIPCGTWLGSEMKRQIEPGFRMEFFNPPVMRDGKGDPSTTGTWVETWIVPKESKHPDIAADFFKFMTSLDMAKRFVAEKDTLMCIIGSDEVRLGPDLVTPARLIRKAKATWDADYANWYPSLGRETETAMAALLNGEMTPKQCVDYMERAAEKARKDKTRPRHRI